MTFREFRTYVHQQLSTVYPKAEVDALCHLLLENSLQVSRAEMVLNRDEPIDKGKMITLLEQTNRLSKQEPIQYIFGQVTFAEVPIKLSPAVLIPRPETERLVYWIKDREPSKPDVLDICTGSGCIAFALEKHLGAKVSAWDLSNQALQQAKQTAQLIGSAVQFSKIDILAQIDTDQKWDIIVSNPPYVLEEEREEMEDGVLCYEPHMALFTAADDSIQFYRAVASFAATHLRPGGSLYFELNPKTFQEVISFLKMMEFIDIVVENDLRNNPRMLVAKTKA